MTTDVIEHNPMLKKPLLAVLAVVAQQADESRTAVEERALIRSKPAYRDVFAAILDACSADEGASRADLERTIDAQPQLQPGPATQRTTVYPQYFIDALETAGGIAWDGRWRTTDAGKAVAAA